MTAAEHANYSNEWWQEHAQELAAERDAAVQAADEWQRKWGLLKTGYDKEIEHSHALAESVAEYRQAAERLDDERHVAWQTAATQRERAEAAEQAAERMDANAKEFYERMVEAEQAAEQARNALLLIPVKWQEVVRAALAGNQPA